MKRIWVILLLFIFSFNILGVFFVIQYRQYQIRQEIKSLIKQGVEEEDLYKITLTGNVNDQVRWIKNHEFLYKGQMYDVVRKEIVGENTTIYYCISDTQETGLFAHLDDLVKKNMDPEKRANAPIKNILKLLSNLYLKSNIFNFHLYWSDIKPAWHFVANYSDPCLARISPPPKW